MASFRFVHAADLHLDTPFTGVARASAPVAEALRDASLEAWDALVELTVRREAAFLVLAGDVYDGSERGVRAQLRFLRGLDRLDTAGVAVLVAHGNHDPLDGWSAIRQWPAAVTVFGSDAVERVAVERDGRRLATVHGTSYGRRDPGENLARRFRRGDEPGLHVGVLHCNAGAHAEHAPYSACTLDDLHAAGLDYWALGHVHAGAILADAPSMIAYPGTLQGRSAAAGELGPKGALVVEVADDRVAGVERVPLDRVRFERLELDVGGQADAGALAAALAREAEARHAAADRRGLVVCAVLRGRGPAHRDLARPGALEGLLADLRSEADGAHPFLWWAAIRDETRAEVDREAVLARGDFGAELCELADGYAAGARRRDALLAAVDERLPLARLRRYLGADLGGDPAELVREAESRALDLVSEGAP